MNLLLKNGGTAEQKRSVFAMAKKSAEKCQHPELHFERGGLYIVCSNPDCQDMWRSVVKPEGVVVNPAARSQGLTYQDVRKKP